MADNDYTDLYDNLEHIINDLEGLSVPDSDLDDMIYEATEKLRDARDKSGERS